MFLLLRSLPGQDGYRLELSIDANEQLRANAVTHTQSSAANCPAHGMHMALNYKPCQQTASNTLAALLTSWRIMRR